MILHVLALLQLIVEHALVFALHLELFFLLSHLVAPDHLHMASAVQTRLHVRNDPSAGALLPLVHRLLLLLLGQVLIVFILLHGTVVVAPLNVELVVPDLVEDAGRLAPETGHWARSRWWQPRPSAGRLRI